MSLASLSGARTLQLPDRNGTDRFRHAAGIGAMPPSSSFAADWIELDEDHPLHLVDRVVGDMLREPCSLVTDRAQTAEGLPGRERLLRSLLLQVLYSIASDGRLLEQLRYDLRFRWFAGLSAGDRVWSPAAHASARGALLQSGAERQLLGELLRGLRPIALIWPEYFSFDESLVERWQADLFKPASSAGASTVQQQELLKSAGISPGRDQVDARLVRALEWILTRIGEPDLNCDSLAADVGMSRRALYYLFDAHDLTPTMAIRNIRLEHCKRLLEDARHSKRKITAIALDYGFSNIYSFSRSFKQRFGIGPRDRRASRLGPARVANS